VCPGGKKDKPPSHSENSHIIRIEMRFEGFKKLFYNCPWHITILKEQADKLYKACYPFARVEFPAERIVRCIQYASKRIRMRFWIEELERQIRIIKGLEKDKSLGINATEWLQREKEWKEKEDWK